MTALSLIALAMMWAFIVLSIAPSRGRNSDEAIGFHQKVQLYRIGIVVSAAVFLVASLAKDIAQ